MIGSQNDAQSEESAIRRMVAPVGDRRIDASAST